MIRRDPSKAPGWAPASSLDLSALGAVIEHAGVPMAVVEQGGVVSYVNPAFCELLGKPPAEILRTRFAALVPAGDDSVELLAGVLRGGGPQSHTEQQPGSHPLFWSYLMWPLLAPGRPAAAIVQVTQSAQLQARTVAMNAALVLGSVRQHEHAQAADAANARLQLEMIERARIEQALRLSEERYRALFSGVPVAIIVYDRAGVVQGWNDCAVELWNGSPPGTVPESLAEGLRTGQSIQNLETSVERQDGVRIPVMVNFHVLNDAAGQASGAIASFDDIGDLKRAQHKALEAGERFHLIAESMPQKIFTATPDGDVDYLNPQWSAFTGLPIEQLRGSGWEACIHPDDLAENLRLWRRSIQTGQPFHAEHRVRRADGRYRWHISRAVALTGAGGRTVMWLGSNTDVHEVKDADLRKSEFVAMLAHELRNPLAPIRFTLEIVKRSADDPQLVAQSVQTMDRQLRQVTRLVDDLMDVSRIGQGKLHLRRKPVDLVAIMHHVLEAAFPDVKSAEHELVVTLPPRAVCISGDEVRLAQVFGNLLSNASKFTAPGGRLAVSLEVVGAEAVVVVKDSGIGIAAELLPRIFDMFTQADQTLERSQSGLGIGLTLVRRLVRMHGGTVHASSGGAGKGSEFEVRLPVLAEHAPTAEPQARLPKPALAGQRILVIDDNHDTANSLAYLLRKAGNDATVGYDGAQALELAAQLRPAIVLLDLGLPQLNGYEAARALRSEPWGADMVLVALTGWGQDDDRQKTTAAGFDGHLVKPVEFAVLTRLLARLLAEKIAARSA